MSKTELATQLGKSMMELRNKLRQEVQIKLKEHDINLSFEMLEVLACLWRKDGINQQELAEMTMKDKSSITYLIDALTKRAMVRRQEDDKDRRNNLIYMTGDAELLKELFSPWLAEIYGRASRGVESTQLQASLKMLDQMIANLS